MVGNKAAKFLTMFLAIWSSTRLVGVSAVLLDVPRRTAVIGLSVFLRGAGVIVLPGMTHIVRVVV